MNKKLLFTAIFMAVSVYSPAQNGWRVCTAPHFSSRVDDIFIINNKTGYAVCGDGQIVKSIDSGNTWTTIFRDTNTYFRSVEFINEQKGFAGGFPIKGVYKNIFLKTLDGGNTWTDLTENLDSIARDGICGLSVADTNTIYGCGNWYSHAYIIKSTDGGNNWQFINMLPYASSLIDMYFISKDTGFVTGKSKPGDTLNTAIILYTTDGGVTWSTKFKNNGRNEYCWKIQRLTDQIYFASIEDLNTIYPSILKSYDGGMSWTKYYVCDSVYNIEGIGFIDPLKGFTGGGEGSFESDDGGKTWKYSSVCPYMDRVFKVNDSVMFATGFQIWKYEKGKNGSIAPVTNPSIINLYCYPNPVNGVLTINFAIARSTRAVLNIYDAQGKLVKSIVNANKPAGDYQYRINMDNVTGGMYFVLLKTHEDQQIVKVLVSH